jgi:hypothetical protein
MDVSFLTAIEITMTCPQHIGEESASPVAPHRLTGEGKQWRRKLRHQEVGQNPRGTLNVNNGKGKQGFTKNKSFSF